MISTKHLVATLSFALLAGCYVAAADGAGNGGNGSNGGSGATTGGTAGDGLPCDVQNVLSKNCWECHGVTPSQKAPNSLVTYEQVSQFADEMISRMKDGTMPPGGMDSADIAVIEDWVSGGKERSSCDTPAPTDTGPDLFSMPPQCSSNKYWPKTSDRESDLMHPGRACIECHTSDEGPSLTIAGTAYPTGHEPDDCNSQIVAGAKVQVLDANKNVVAEAPVNSVGNFFIKTRTLAHFPAGGRVQIVSKAGTRVMNDTPKTGDCNSCHTQDGANDAPGRIVFPQ